MEAASAPLDLALTNLTVLTGVPGAKPHRDAAVGVRDRRIAWIGPASEVPPSRATQSLAGRVVIPGLLNVHTHSALVMVRGIAADLGFAPSYTAGIPNALDLSPAEAASIARLGALEALLAGSTLIGEHFVHIDHCLPALAELGLRVHASMRLHDVDFHRVARGEWRYDRALGDALLERNIAMYERWHEHADGRVQVQFAAHAADTCSDAYLRSIALEANRHAAIVNTHLAQSTVEIDRVHARSGRTPTEAFDAAGLLNDRLLCGHCLYVTDADIAQLARAGAHAVHIPKCNAASGRIAPTPKLREAGVNIALASDTQHGDMIELMRWALATARIQEGRVTDDWQPRDVFAMATLNGARALGLQHELGSIEVGKRADLVVLDFRRPHLTPSIDPLGTLIHCALGRDVEQVFVDGECVVRDGRPTRVDMDAVIAEANDVINSLWRRAA